MGVVVGREEGAGALRRPGTAVGLHLEPGKYLQRGTRQSCFVMWLASSETERKLQAVSRVVSSGRKLGCGGESL